MHLKGSTTLGLQFPVVPFVIFGQSQNITLEPDGILESTTKSKAKVLSQFISEHPQRQRIWK